MIYAAPALSERDRDVLAEIEDLRTELRYYLREPRRWYGTLRRSTLARAMQGSNSIGGYHASVEDVAALIEHEEPLEADEVEVEQLVDGQRLALRPDLAGVDLGQQLTAFAARLGGGAITTLRDLNPLAGQWIRAQGDLHYVARWEGFEPPTF